MDASRFCLFKLEDVLPARVNWLVPWDLLKASMHRMRCVEPSRIARLIIARKWGHKQGFATFPRPTKKRTENR
jgi:hypothetical protein